MTIFGFLSQIDWTEIGKTLGVPAAILFFVLGLVGIYFKTMLPVWKANAEAEVKLKNTLATQLPIIAKGAEDAVTLCRSAIESCNLTVGICNRTLEEVKELTGLMREFKNEN